MIKMSWGNSWVQVWIQYKYNRKLHINSRRQKYEGIQRCLASNVVGLYVTLIFNIVPKLSLFIPKSKLFEIQNSTYVLKTYSFWNINVVKTKFSDILPSHSVCGLQRPCVPASVAQHCRTLWAKKCSNPSGNFHKSWWWHHVGGENKTEGWQW